MGHLVHGARPSVPISRRRPVGRRAGAIDRGVVPAVAQGDETIVIDMEELNDSGVSGTATLEPDGDVTVVSLELEGATGDHPAHVHEGTCEDLDPNPAYPLTDVNADGVSETTIEVPLADLLASPHAVNVHRSTEDIGTYVACGNIVAPEEEAAGGEADATAEADADRGIGRGRGSRSRGRIAEPDAPTRVRAPPRPGRNRGRWLGRRRYVRDNKGAGDGRW